MSVLEKEKKKEKGHERSLKFVNKQSCVEKELKAFGSAVATLYSEKR